MRGDGSAAASGFGTADITITEIDLDNTLLLDAVNKGKARFVSDCASYLQVRLVFLEAVLSGGPAGALKRGSSRSRLKHTHHTHMQHTPHTELHEAGD